MPRVRKYVHDENIRSFKAKLKAETDPHEIRRLEDLIQEEEDLYETALRLLRDENSSAEKGD